MQKMPQSLLRKNRVESFGKDHEIQWHAAGTLESEEVV